MSNLEVVPEDLSAYRVIDIREAQELAEDPLPYEEVEWMPLSEWTGEGMDDRPTLFVCRSGVRSLRLTVHMREQGKPNTFSLPGGLTKMREISSNL